MKFYDRDGQELVHGDCLETPEGVYGTLVLDDVMITDLTAQFGEEFAVIDADDGDAGTYLLVCPRMCRYAGMDTNDILGDLTGLVPDCVPLWMTR